MGRVVVISGYFNPIHRGHIEYAQAARDLAGPGGFVYAIVNSDAQAILKKGYSFVPEADRLAVVGALRSIDRAVPSIDADRTVCQTLEALCTGDGPRPTHFLNDGDSAYTGGSPEAPICARHGVEMVFAGNPKKQSSSWILESSVRTAYAHLPPAPAPTPAPAP